MSLTNWMFLSHALGEATPGYGGEKGFRSEKRSEICKGCSSNSQEWHLYNHIGTHVDAPLHFAETGRPVDDFSAGFWVFENVCFLDLPLEPGEILYPERVADSIALDADLILLRSGFEKRRQEEVYWKQNPGLSPELGAWLRANRSQVRAIGFDFISVTSYPNRPLGREAHKAFLDPSRQGLPILAIEDMALSQLRKAPKRVVVAPWRVEGADGGPVTVFAEFNCLTDTPVLV